MVFDEPQRGATPGQSAVFYIDDIVLRWTGKYINIKNLQKGVDFFKIL